MTALDRNLYRLCFANGERDTYAAPDALR